ncbi:MAG: NUDIX domain-containing protein [Armatimonadota bacterium]|nr:NUDIX domain-containing protein [Armatimonadota bacterium]
MNALIVRDSAGSGGGTRHKVLLTRRAVEPHKGMWDTPGGFVDIGELTEEAVIRECAEELGVEVRIRGLVSISADTYGGEHTLVLSYWCELGSGEPHPADDVDAVAWFPVSSPAPLAFRNGQEAIRALRGLLDDPQTAPR